MIRTVSERYRTRVKAGEIERDPAQEGVVGKLDALEALLRQRLLARKSSSLGWLFGRPQAIAIRGLYLFGKVGRGKTLLMDLFFESSLEPRKRRAHFHEFMLDVHARIHDWRQRHKRGQVTGDDPIAAVAAVLADEARLLCFDELNVTDIADAMILGRLFSRLFEHGVVVVATSNVAPEDLYRGGLNRPLFLPFIALIERHMEVLRLDARTDFRLEKLGSHATWHAPTGTRADAALDAAWRGLMDGTAEGPFDLSVKGHILHVPRAANGAARFPFAALCEQPLGAVDYLRLAEEFHTLVVDGIPVLGPERRNAAKRFITLIDMLYDRAVKLVASAEAEPDAICRTGDGFEQREFQRTASRLFEMQASSYLALPHGRQPPEQTPAGIVET
jgi:cell division protein ZapE